MQVGYDRLSPCGVQDEEKLGKMKRCDGTKPNEGRRKLGRVELGLMMQQEGNSN